MLKICHYLSLLVLLMGCAMPTKGYSLPENGVIVRGDKLYHNDSPFAEIRYLKEEFGSQQYLIIGFAVYYYQHNKEIWIFPKEGWSVRKGEENYSSIPDIVSFWSREKHWREQGYHLYLVNERYNQKLMPTVTDIHISEDGKYISYKTPGIFFSSSHKYLIKGKNRKGENRDSDH